MDLQPQLLSLQDILCGALQKLPGAGALQLFGSLAAVTGDQYSDIDLLVLTTDLPASVAACHAILKGSPSFLVNQLSSCGSSRQTMWSICCASINTSIVTLSVA